jgi:long-chain fatty acid transport protein
MARNPQRQGAISVLAALGAMAAGAGGAEAGGFAIREQSATFQGMSYAGAAAGGALSSMYWNPAATAVLPGLNTESSYTLVVPEATVTVRQSPFPQGLFPNSSDITEPIFTSASYGSYQLTGYDPRLFFGVAVNGPFGLLTEPDREGYLGAVLGRTTKLLTVNVNPTVAYRLAPGLLIGAGAQIQYADAALRFATGLPTGITTSFSGNDVAFGVTAGILWSPAPGTSIGLGWRSQMDQTLEGSFSTAHTPLSVSGKATLELPDTVTLSLMQAVSPVARVMGTIEWAGWSRLDKLRVEATGFGATVLDPVTVPGQTIATLPLDWSDGWFFSLGGEYDLTPRLTVRTGAAYEISPIDAPEKRPVSIPDSDRVWLSGGASYRWSEWTSVDLAYSHIFYADAGFVRTPVGSQAIFTGDIDASADLITVGLKTRWGGDVPLK